MSTFDIKIDRLQLRIDSAAGHEHRIGPIAQRAAALLAERIDERWKAAHRVSSDQHQQSITAAPLNMNLNNVSDEQAAGEIANAWLDALSVRLGV